MMGDRNRRRSRTSARGRRRGFFARRRAEAGGGDQATEKRLASEGCRRKNLRDIGDASTAFRATPQTFPALHSAQHDARWSCVYAPRARVWHCRSSSDYDSMRRTSKRGARNHAPCLKAAKEPRRECATLPVR